MARAYELRSAPSLWIARLRGGATPLRRVGDLLVHYDRLPWVGVRVYTRTRRPGTFRNTRFRRGSAAYYLLLKFKL
jgi:hypothetical protein